MQPKFGITTIQKLGEGTQADTQIKLQEQVKHAYDFRMDPKMLNSSFAKKKMASPLQTEVIAYLC